MINFLNLEYFLVAAEESSITKAARKLNISQQSLSSHIANLEKEFDIALFNRTLPLTLTYAGQMLAKHAREILHMRDETYRELADIKDFSKGRLTIGMSHTRGRRVLPEILPVYREQFPNIELHLREGNTRELDADLLHGEVDLIIDMLPIKGENIETVPVCEEEILLIVPDSLLEKLYPGRVGEIRARLEETADLALLADCPFLLINPGNRVRSLAEEMFADAQISPPIVLETENIETVLSLSLKGMGATFYPKMFMTENDEGRRALTKAAGIGLYHLNHPKAHCILGIGYHKGHYMSRATQEFIRVAKEQLQKYSRKEA